MCPPRFFLALYSLNNNKSPMATAAKPITPTAIPAFWTGVMEPPDAAAAGSAVEELVPVISVVVLTTAVLKVVSGLQEGENVGECVSMIKVVGGCIRVNGLFVFEGAGYDIGPPPDGGTASVAVMTPWVGVRAPGSSLHI